MPLMLLPPPTTCPCWIGIRPLFVCRCRRPAWGVVTYVLAIFGPSTALNTCSGFSMTSRTSSALSDPPASSNSTRPRALRREATTQPVVPAPTTM